VFVEAMTHPKASRTTFEVVSCRGPAEPLGEQFERLEPDVGPAKRGP